MTVTLVSGRTQAISIEQPSVSLACLGVLGLVDEGGAAREEFELHWGKPKTTTLRLVCFVFFFFFFFFFVLFCFFFDFIIILFVFFSQRLDFFSQAKSSEFISSNEKMEETASSERFFSSISSLFIPFSIFFFLILGDC